MALPTRILSLCAGAEMLGAAVQIAVPEAVTVCMVEREAQAGLVLAARMAEGSLAKAPVWDDLVTFDGLPWRGKVDLVIAGIPCQGNSIAGQRFLELDERNLWPDTRRILREVGCGWFLLENVPGIAVPNRGSGLGAPAARIVGELAEDGFVSRWLPLSAAAVGASHRRERFWLLARHRERGGELPVAFGSHQSVSRGQRIGAETGEGREPRAERCGATLADTRHAQRWQDGCADGGGQGRAGEASGASVSSRNRRRD